MGWLLCMLLQHASTLEIFGEGECCLGDISSFFFIARFIKLCMGIFEFNMYVYCTVIHHLCICANIIVTTQKHSAYYIYTVHPY